MRACCSVVALTTCLVLTSVASASASDPRPPGRTQSSTATLISDAPVYKHPGDAKRIRIASAVTSWTWSRTVLLVLRSARDSRDRLWLKVLLPVRPNESAGWILAQHAKKATRRRPMYAVEDIVSHDADGRLRLDRAKLDVAHSDTVSAVLAAVRGEVATLLAERTVQA